MLLKNKINNDINNLVFRRKTKVDGAKQIEVSTKFEDYYINIITLKRLNKLLIKVCAKNKDRNSRKFYENSFSVEDLMNKSQLFKDVGIKSIKDASNFFYTFFKEYRRHYSIKVNEENNLILQLHMLRGKLVINLELIFLHEINKESINELNLQVSQLENDINNLSRNIIKLNKNEQETESKIAKNIPICPSMRNYVNNKGSLRKKRTDKLLTKIDKVTNQIIYKSIDKNSLKRLSNQHPLTNLSYDFLNLIKEKNNKDNNTPAVTAPQNLATEESDFLAFDKNFTEENNNFSSIVNISNKDNNITNLISDLSRLDHKKNLNRHKKKNKETNKISSDKSVENHIKNTNEKHALKIDSNYCGHSKVKEPSIIENINNTENNTYNNKLLTIESTTNNKANKDNNTTNTKYNMNSGVFSTLKNKRSSRRSNLGSDIKNIKGFQDISTIQQRSYNDSSNKNNVIKTSDKNDCDNISVSNNNNTFIKQNNDKSNKGKNVNNKDNNTNNPNKITTNFANNISNISSILPPSPSPIINQSSPKKEEMSLLTNEESPFIYDNVPFLSQTKKDLINLFLIYRASEEKNGPCFHRKCDNQGANLVVVKTENRQKYACFTQLSWRGVSEREMGRKKWQCYNTKDEEMAVFDLTRFIQLTSFSSDKRAIKVIQQYENYGPSYVDSNGLSFKIFGNDKYLSISFIQPQDERREIIDYKKLGLNQNNFLKIVDYEVYSFN